MKKENFFGFEKIEKESKVNFLDRDISLTFSFGEEAVRYLPEIRETDLETGRERYAVLLGSISQEGEKDYHLLVRGILEADENENNHFYREGKYEITLDLVAIKDWVQSIREGVEECRDFEFIGDIHTHPDLFEGNLDLICQPSQGDIDDIIANYENEVLRPDKPFIFGIVGMVDGENQYGFYRLVKDGHVYSLESLKTDLS